MSRLIDADKFKEYIVDGFEQNKDLFTDEQRDFVKVITCGLLKDIDEQPTAYDVDKVVEQLEECKTKKYVSGITNTPYEFGACHAMDDAIKIVKGGGSKMIIDYTIAKECSNPEVFYTCYQCGKCGRVFEDGIMIDDGGTTIDEEE